MPGQRSTIAEHLSMGICPCTLPADRNPIFDDPTTTPWDRLLGLADSIGFQTMDLAAEEVPEGGAGFVLTDGERPPVIALSTGVDADLRTDALAFAIALISTEEDRGTSKISAGILADRLPQSAGGVGAVAWWMLHDLGRITTSATFATADVDC
jgi:hypothetical protein